MDDGVNSRIQWVSDGTRDGAHPVDGVASSEADQDWQKRTATSVNQGDKPGNPSGLPIDIAQHETIDSNDDLKPLPFSTIPENVTIAEDTMFFITEDFVNGRALWARPLESEAEIQAWDRYE